MLRSVLSVAAGFMVMVITVVIGTALTARIMLGDAGSNTIQQPPNSYLVASLVVSAAAAVLGGWVTGLIAGREPLIHAGALSILLLVMSAVSVLLTRGTPEAAAQPSWYPWVVTVLGAAGVLLGGVLRGGQLRGGQQNA
ncbi:MAG TPA: hypothetical protein VFD58_27780 [Blastocatellia bacterium]|nr:hypothetical protein [Blastocatellia bacterium]